MQNHGHNSTGGPYYLICGTMPCHAPCTRMHACMHRFKDSKWVYYFSGFTLFGDVHTRLLEYYSPRYVPTQRSYPQRSANQCTPVPHHNIAPLKTLNRGKRYAKVTYLGTILRFPLFVFVMSGARPIKAERAFRIPPKGYGRSPHHSFCILKNRPLGLEF